MLNAAALNYTAGRIRHALAVPPTFFLGGTPIVQGLLAVRKVDPTFFIAGLGYTAVGELCISNTLPVVSVNGLGFTATGRLCANDAGNGVIATYAGGIPLSADGKVILAAVEVPGGSGFSSGFSTGFGT